MSTLNAENHPQGRVVGNRIYYDNNSSSGLSCSFGPYTRPKALSIIFCILFIFATSVLNLALGNLIPGLVFLGFSIVMLSILIWCCVRHKAQNQGMQPNVTYNHVPGQVIPGQNQGPTYPAVHIHPPQQYTAQPYPTQPLSAPIYPSQAYPSPVTQAQPHTPAPSMSAVQTQGVQAPMQMPGEPLAQPPPPTYDEAMNFNQK